MEFKDVEVAREKYYAKFKKGLIISGVIALIILVLSIILFFTSGSRPFAILPGIGFGFIIGVFGLVITVLLSRTEAEAYRKAYKTYFVATSLSRHFTDLNYDHKAGISEELIRSTGMINTADTFTSNDLTVARYKDVKLIQSDAHIQEEHTDSDGNTTYATIFKGRFMIFEFPKKFNFKLELIGRNFYAFSVPGKDAKTGRNMQVIQTESNDFNAAFRIYAEDGFEAFYLLDPAMMVKIQSIAERYGYKILLGFLSNTLLVALNDDKDSFEPPFPSHPLDEKTEQAKIGDDIKVITDFIDQLSLDRKLFKS